MNESIAELLRLAALQGKTIGAVARSIQAQSDGVSEAALTEAMANALDVMADAAAMGLDPQLRSMSGMTGGQAHKLHALSESEGLRGGFLAKACGYALAVAEYNAAMGKIVAAPTAGASGVLPGVLLAAEEEGKYPRQALVDALFTAAALGEVIAREATISGAEGGCQAECGSAAAMAAAALVELMGGTPEAAVHGFSFALMNLLGLVCDPVGGLVEIPCVYRNVGAVGIAYSSALMAVSGVPCPIPGDEMVQAMKDVGDLIAPSLRETGEGGCAACPSMRKMPEL